MTAACWWAGRAPGGLASRLAVSALVVAACGSTDRTEDRPADAGSGGTEGSVEAGTGRDALPSPRTVVVLNAVRINSDSKKENFQEATGEIDLGSGPFARATLLVDLDTTCFPFEKWKANPPPAGENYPADCDAFDRSFEIELDAPDDPDTDPPAIELMRAITPFGGPLHLEVDMTDIANARPGRHRLTVRISTWSDAAGQVTGSDGGWNVTASVTLTPGPAPRRVLAVRSVFNGSTGVPAGEPLVIETPEGAVSTRLEYRATGHGGVLGAPGCAPQPAEEFCRREHAILVDESLVAAVDPWRDDCGDLCTVEHYGSATTGFDYCAENPTGAIESVRAPRANWCPGSLTPPIEWDFPSLRAPGEHSFRWRISDVADGGSWRISATFFAFAD